MANSIVDSIVGIIVAVVLIVAAAIPVSISVINAQNWTGYTSAQQIVQLTPLALGVVLLVVVFSAVSGSAGG